MQIDVLASGSTGNAYIIDDGATRIMIECGLPWKALQRASGFTLSSLDAVLISHEHGDHAKAVRDVLKNGIDVYCSRGTADALGITDSYRCHTMAPMKNDHIGTLHVVGIPVEHDAAEPYGYIISSQQTGERLLFATDTPYIGYTVPGLTHAMIEANYCDEATEGTDPVHLSRIMRSHMSIDALERWIRTTGVTDTIQQIWLLHLSDGRSNEAEFKRRIQVACGAEVYIAN